MLLKNSYSPGATHLGGIVKIGDVGGVVAGFADHDAVEVLRRGVLLAPRRPLLGAPRVRLEAVVEEVVDHSLPGRVLRPPQVGVGVVPTLCRVAQQDFTSNMSSLVSSVLKGGETDFPLDTVTSPTCKSSSKKAGSKNSPSLVMSCCMALSMSIVGPASLCARGRKDAFHHSNHKRKQISPMPTCRCVTKGHDEEHCGEPSQRWHC